MMIFLARRFSRFKRIAMVVSAMALVLGAILFSFRSGNHQPNSPRYQSSESQKRELPTALDVTPKITGGGAKLFADYLSKSTTQADDLDLIADVLDRYFLLAKSEISRYPMGDNREVTRVLAGHNPMSVEFLPRDHKAINKAGELTDRWGNPLFFHGLSADLFEIVSAGPDAEFFTEDDVRYSPKLAQR